MRIPNDCFVVVADGRKMLLLRNDGDADYPNLVVEEKHRQQNPPDRDQKSAEAGRAFSSASDRRSKFEETDFHQLEEDRFAVDVAEMLYERAFKGEFDKLIVVAPPRTLGEMRKHYHKEVGDRLIGEIDKDLTGHVLVDIEKIIVESD